MKTQLEIKAADIYNLTIEDLLGLDIEVDAYKDNQYQNLISEYMVINNCNWETANKWLCKYINTLV